MNCGWSPLISGFYLSREVEPQEEEEVAEKEKKKADPPIATYALFLSLSIMQP